jgi:hypothetical protein
LLYFKRIRDLSYATSLRLAEIRLEYATLHAGHASSDESQPFFRWRDWISHSSIHGWGNREAQSSRREWQSLARKFGSELQESNDAPALLAGFRPTNPSVHGGTLVEITL